MQLRAALARVASSEPDVRRLNWKRRVYATVKRGLERSRLERWVGMYCCELLISRELGLKCSGWDEDGLWLGEVGPAQLPWLAELQPARVREFAARWRQGHRCFGAGLRFGSSGQGRCAAYSWIASGPTEITATTGARWVIPPAAAWAYDSWSNPLALGTHPDLVRYVWRQLSSEGMAAVLGQIECTNRASLRLHERIGNRVLGCMFSVRMGAHSLHVLRSGLGWQLGRSAMAVPLQALMQQPAPLAAARAATVAGAAD